MYELHPAYRYTLLRTVAHARRGTEELGGIVFYLVLKVEKGGSPETHSGWGVLVMAHRNQRLSEVLLADYLPARSRIRRRTSPL